ncbi:hypothetical protein MCOR02_012149 [Pyricularia oryzae]|nr:hypothetical protein MCOR02_012149 [Pyricularia oryzae]
MLTFLRESFDGLVPPGLHLHGASRHPTWICCSRSALGKILRPPCFANAVAAIPFTGNSTLAQPRWRTMTNKGNHQ